MKKNEILQKAMAMPLTSPSYPRGPYRFINREYFIIFYRTDKKSLEEVIPEPLTITDPIVKFEFMHMPDVYGFGEFYESGQVIPVTYEGNHGGYVHAMYLNSEAPISGGREIWGFPKKLAQPSLKVEKDTLVGTLDYGSVRIATGTMGYKYEEANQDRLLNSLKEPQFLLKIIPDVQGKCKICQLVSCHLEDITLHGAWQGPAALDLFSHALAPVAKLPVLEVVSCVHFVADLTLGFGKIVFDYLESSS